ncbi:ABC transporter permease [Labrys wisconsinensis]|uniref:Spermidine/putrescine transport system permease protein n=1 Tax=Labrys wisconsinensis TaxID=425677 RepID=A0ABU0JDP1_9HYPH|nr:ABC transporter permease [Labrys wisconsinensis]MDQ0471735.1 spermidine/putrescine transport system permease protein [Labrys wisconsinensis]
MTALASSETAVAAAREHSAEQEARRRDVVRRWLLSAPALLIIFLGAVGPLVIVVVYSFLAPGDYGGVSWKFSTDAWFNVLFERDIFDDSIGFASANISIFWRSVLLSFYTTVLALLVGFPTAFFIATRPERQRDLWVFAITIPFWTNLLIRTLAIMELIRNEGLVNLVLIKLGLIDRPIQILFTDSAVMMGMLYVYLPLMVLPIYASLERFDFRLVEAGYDLYANRFQVLRRVILPIVKPGIVAGSILVFIPSLGAYVTPRLLGGNKSMMLGNLMELQFGQARNWPLGAALALFLTALVTVALIVYVRAVAASTRKAAHG